MNFAWEAMQITIDEADSRRFRYSPHGETDWVQMNAPILSVGAGPYGVVFQCADHGLYLLQSETGEPCDTRSWVIRILEYLR